MNSQVVLWWGRPVPEDCPHLDKMTKLSEDRYVGSLTDAECADIEQFRNTNPAPTPWPVVCVRKSAEAIRASQS